MAVPQGDIGGQGTPFALRPASAITPTKNHSQGHAHHAEPPLGQVAACHRAT